MAAGYTCYNDASMMEPAVPDLSAEQRYLFAHPLIREVVYEGLSPFDHARLHGLALQIFEEFLPLEDGQVAIDTLAGELAQHAQAARTVTATDAEYDLLMRKEQQYLERAARFSMPRKGPAETQTGEVSRTAGDVLRVSGRHREAEAWHLENLGKKNGDRPWLTADHYAGLATIYMETGRIAQSADMFSRAIDLFRQWGHRRAALIATVNLATAKRHLGQLEESKALFDAANEQQAECGDRLSESFLAVHTAIFYHETGRTTVARVAYIHALELMRDLGERRLEGMTLGALANLYRSLGYTARAEAAYKEALALHEAMRDARGAGIVLGNMASMFHDTGRLPEAEEMYVQAIDVHRDSGNLRSEAIARGNLGILYRETGRIAGANRLFMQAISQLEQVGDTAIRAAFMSERGALCLLSGDLDSAAFDARDVEQLIPSAMPAMRLKHALPLQFRLAVAKAMPLDSESVDGATRELELAKARAALAEMRQRFEEAGHKSLSPTAKLIAACEAALREAEAALHEWRPPRLFNGYLPSELPPRLRAALLGLLHDLDKERFESFCWQNPYLHASMKENTDGSGSNWNQLPER